VKGETLTSQHIGEESVNTNPVFLRRILGMLNRAGLVASQPGVKGGWRLVREPSQISLLDVYRAVTDGHLLPLHHSPPNPDCPVGGNIQHALTLHFGIAEEAFEQALAQQTIAQLLQTTYPQQSTA
jgi:Rrf2 family protein